MIRFFLFSPYFANFDDLYNNYGVKKGFLIFQFDKFFNRSGNKIWLKTFKSVNFCS